MTSTACVTGKIYHLNWYAQIKSDKMTDTLKFIYFFNQNTQGAVLGPDPPYFFSAKFPTLNFFLIISETFLENYMFFP